ncbi:MAG: (Fe-S)-binding protein [Candidatus Helarchaeota archaeon]
MSIQLKDYEKEFQICAKCGYCRDECAIWKAIGYESVTPRGKILLFNYYKTQKEPIPPKLITNWYLCCTCGRCAEVCPLEINFPELIRTLRIQFAKNDKNIPKPFRKATANVLSTGNPLGRDHNERMDWLPDEITLTKGAPNLFFVGCMTSYWTLDTAELIARILNKIHLPFSLLEDETCCGYLEFWSGEIDKAKEIAQNLATTIQTTGVKTIFTACPGCYSTLKYDYPKLGVPLPAEILHISELFFRLIKTGSLKFTNPLNLTVTYHDPCHLGRFHGIYEEPRELLKAIPGVKLVEMDYNRQEANCCGGPLRTAFLEEAKKIGEMRAKEAANTGADYLTTICPQCVISLRQSAGDFNYTVVDLIVIIAKALGIDEADDFL